MDTLEIITLILALISGLYAWLTHRIAVSNERSVAIMAKQTDLLTRPYVDVSVFTPPKSHVFYLRIRNSGRTAARNLRLQVDRDFFPFGRQSQPSLVSLAAFREAITSFGPIAQLTFALGSAVDIFREDTDPKIMPQEFRITASYEYDNGSVSETSHVDLRPYRLSAMEPSPLVDELERIREVLETRK